MTENQKFWDAIGNLIENYIGAIHAELDDRWEKWQIDLSVTEMHEVIGALLARQVSLATQLARAPEIWNGNVAPILLRVMIDVYINLAWISIEPKDRSQKFILYGLGQQKLNLEHRRQQLSADGFDPKDDPLIKVIENWINSQRYEFLVDVDVGSWSGIDVRTMAEESNCLDLYRYSYTPFSGAVHSMWSHIGRLNLKECQNPLHKFHKAPFDPDLPLDIDYLHSAAKYVAKSFRMFDEKFGVSCSMPSGFELLEKGLDEISELIPNNE